MENEKHHIVPYRTFLFILLALLALTSISVEVTRINLGTLTVTIALLIAAIKSSLVLSIFMHLKFDNKMYSLMAIAVILLIGVVIFITFLDYLYR
ncbi:MAG: cytochrome C oxidase subunit IV family protein [Bacteroidales bacterium]|nr:cytochrome C oxidase subunit IV family protein [Bacteroidales bacterium]MCB8999692.1 cytochrome C oxidase subunit IV family protein [Bacteroidales bacterium]